MSDVKATWTREQECKFWLSLNPDEYPTMPEIRLYQVASKVELKCGMLAARIAFRIAQWLGIGSGPSINALEALADRKAILRKRGVIA